MPTMSGFSVYMSPQCPCQGILIDDLEDNTDVNVHFEVMMKKLRGIHTNMQCLSVWRSRRTPSGEVKRLAMLTCVRRPIVENGAEVRVVSFTDNVMNIVRKTMHTHTFINTLIYAVELHAVLCWLPNEWVWNPMQTWMHVEVFLSCEGHGRGRLPQKVLEACHLFE
jgi:hypothetical protein